MRLVVIFTFALTILYGQASDPAADPAYADLTAAFTALQSRHYDAAIASFGKAAALSPKRTDIRKNLAYTLLKTGDTEAARAQFGEAMRIDPVDFHVALEYAFLCYEARDDAPARKAEARRIFWAVSNSGDADSRATAAATFRDIDEPLRAGIARWQQALGASPPSFSAHYELAQLAEQRDELDLAVSSYKAAFRLLPERKSVLLELARVEKTRANAEGMMAALIAASRGPEPRTAELAREQLPERYPYVYEFREAIELDPDNDALHKELGYLLIRMSETGQASRSDAEKEFALVVNASPDDESSSAQLGLLYLEDHHEDLAMPLLNRVLAKGTDATANRVRTALHMPVAPEQRTPSPDIALGTAPDPRDLAERSYQAGFLKDALRYFQQAHEANPHDASLELRLAWTNNLLHDDATALRWFAVASQSDDPAIAAEAKRALTNLRPDRKRIRTTVWLFPLFSSRWGDLFGYGQVKTELRWKHLPLHPYGSIRLAGDVRRSTSGPLPQALSESAFIAAAGVASDTRHGATGWFEAGIAVGYLSGGHWSDYRGGVSYAHTRGVSLASDGRGWFLETTADSVYISHFGEDFINYEQNRAGYSTQLGSTRAQAFWSQNITFDVKEQYWANFVEMGPGVRLHPKWAPPPVWINVSVIRGVYLRNDGNPGHPNFNDFRIGVWYAFTK